MIRRLYGVDPEVVEVDPQVITSSYGALGEDGGPSLPLAPGAYNWVIDAGGRLVVWFMVSHRDLSGGGPVAGAGKFRIDDSTAIVWVGLNHSRHYHPPLTAQYARLVYDVFNQAALLGLLTLSHAARYEGRVKDGESWILLRLDATDLSRDSERLAWLIAGDIG